MLRVSKYILWHVALTLFQSFNVFGVMRADALAAAAGQRVVFAGADI